jgi:hypothetical protein
MRNGARRVSGLVWRIFEAATADIAIGKIEAGDWLDPSEEPISWPCALYDPEGKRVDDGDPHSPER